MSYVESTKHLFRHPEKPTLSRDYQVGGRHYADKPVQPWDVIDTWPLEQRVGFYRGNAIKYAVRLDDKDTRLDNARKLQHYADKLVSVLEESA